jgi:hypothetical protein
VCSKPDPALVKMQQRQQQAEYRCAAQHRFRATARLQCTQHAQGQPATSMT